MKITPDLKTGTVLIRLTPRESVALADKLTRAAIASGGAVADERPEPTEPDVEEREG